MLLYSFMTIPPLIFFLLITSTPTSSMDPLSWGMVAGAGVFTSFLYSSYDSIKASFPRGRTPAKKCSKSGKSQFSVFGLHIM